MSLPPYVVSWHAAGTVASDQPGIYTDNYPVQLIDGSHLVLPLRPLPGGERAISLLMSNQTPFYVEQALANRLTELVRELEPEMIVAVPTMGLDYARLVAAGIGLPHYVALGLSRKFWYEDTLSESTVSSTSPEQAKSIYLDPALLDRVAGRRVVLIDDVINTGVTAAAAIRLLARAGAKIEALAVVLTEGAVWQTTLAATDGLWAGRILSLGHIPLFKRSAQGWQPD